MFSTIKELRHIDGWLTERELKLLLSYSSKVKKGKVILEIGSWKGRSTLCLLEGAKKNHAKVVAVDTFKGSAEHGDVDTYDEFIANINRHADYGNLEVIRDASENAAQKWNGEISLLFIDGSHKYEDVEKDFNSWEGKVEKGGYILFHDSFPQGWLDVQLFIIRRLFGNDDYNFIKAVDTISVFRKEPRRHRNELRFKFDSPLHEFLHNGIGLSGKEVRRKGRYPDEIFSPRNGWNWALAEYGNFRFPFISYRSRYIKFYIGWLPKGNFGFKSSLNLKGGY
ncbi:MAG: class I SAM-dependent methyltransferase [Nitrospirae bacterium]|nr:class I SAM-dependent methyltransferase [Nitrospirota bacterium]